MTNTEIENLKEIIQRVLEIDFLKTAKELFQNENLNEIKIAHEYPLLDGINILNRALKKLNSELNTENSVYLPYRLAIPDIGTSDIWDLNLCLSKIIDSCVSSTSFPEIGFPIRWLVTYELLCGFWNNPTQTKFTEYELKIEKTLMEIEDLSKQLKGIIDRSKNIELQSENAIYNIIELTKQKNDEFAQLSNLVGKATNESSQITQLWEQATRQKGEFDNLINQASESIKNINTQTEFQKNEYFTLKNEINADSTLLNINLSESNTKLNDINSKESVINERMNQAAQLLGLSADSALGNKFSLRELSVKKDLFWWRIAVVISVVLSIGWAVAVFICFSNYTTGYPLIDLAVNLIKTTPGFILMGYIMSQYNKERTIEEEYAFKAAIAMTINAYADLLKDNDSQPNTSRQTMLLNAIDQVYKKPKMHKEHINAKTYKENAKELIEILKNLKN